MSGVQIIVAQLLDSAAVTAIADPDSIVGGTLPQGTPLPALQVETISEMDLQVLSRGAYRLVTERVQVTALGLDYVQAHDLIKAAKRACADTFPTIAGLSRISVLSAGGGPEGIHVATGAPARTHDFKVRYQEPT